MLFMKMAQAMVIRTVTITVKILQDQMLSTKLTGMVKTTDNKRTSRKEKYKYVVKR